MKYEQVETNKRRPLPFVKPAVRSALMRTPAALAALVPDEPTCSSSRCT